MLRPSREEIRPESSIGSEDTSGDSAEDFSTFSDAVDDTKGLLTEDMGTAVVTLNSVLDLC
jgi:hypothetical protein